MTRRGFALLTVLWMLAALGTVAGAALAVARTGSMASGNRVALTRGSWAREACVQILLARYRRDPLLRALDTVDLGRGSWCRVEVENTAARLDLNFASPDALRAIVGNDSLTDALLDWRDGDDIQRPLGAEADWYRRERRRLPRNGPLADVAELRLIRGFDSITVDRLTPLLSTEGTKQVDLTAAPQEVLATLPGVSPEVVAVLMYRRRMRETIDGADQLLARLSAPARQELLRQYQEFIRLAVFAAPRLTATVEGGVRGSVAVSRATLTLVPIAQRLAVVSRRTE
jgi:general secretion pathway protein K